MIRIALKFSVALLCFSGAAWLLDGVEALRIVVIVFLIVAGCFLLARALVEGDFL